MPPGSPPATLDSNSHILNVKYKGFDFGTLGAYAYLLDLENNASNSNASYGLRLTGKYDFNQDTSVQYEAEYATPEHITAGANVLLNAVLKLDAA